MDEYVTSAEAAELKGVSQSTVARWCADGWIQCVKMGKTWLVNRAALLSFDPPPRGPKPTRRDEEGGGH